MNTQNRQYKLPWLCFGDFNEILSRNEKLGCASRPQQQMDSFRNAVERCNFKDMGYYGLHFTWCNQQEGDDRIYLRLDRAFATIDWLDHFSSIKVHHLLDITSDHCPLLLTESITIGQRRGCRFHFKAMWTRRADCKEIIEEGWNESMEPSMPGGIAVKIKQCAFALTSWSNLVFGHTTKKIKEKKKVLSNLIVQDTEGQNGAKIN